MRHAPDDIAHGCRQQPGPSPSSASSSRSRSRSIAPQRRMLHLSMAIENCTFFWYSLPSVVPAAQPLTATAGVKSLRNPIYSCPWHGHRRCRLEALHDGRPACSDHAPDGRCRRSVARQECVESSALALCRRDSTRHRLRHIATGPTWLIVCLIVLAFIPLVLVGIGFVVLLLGDSDKLQSEEYQIRKRTLEMIGEKGQEVSLVDLVEAARLRLTNKDDHD